MMLKKCYLFKLGFHLKPPRLPLEFSFSSSYNSIPAACSFREKIQVHQQLALKKEQKSHDNSDDEDACDAELEQKFHESNLFADLTLKLARKASVLERAEAKMAEMREQWSQARGDAELAREIMVDLQSKHS